MMHKKQKQGFRKAAAILLLLTPALFGQDTHTTMQPSHLVLVSIPDRKLAVVENGRILRTFSVAVGSVNSPSPAGEFRVVARLKGQVALIVGSDHAAPDGQDVAQIITRFGDDFALDAAREVDEHLAAGVGQML